MRIAMLALLIVCAADAAAARDAMPGRYEVNRLGIETEAVPFCAWRAGAWICRSVAEERAAHEQEIARLKNQVAALTRRLAAVGEPPALVPAPVLGPPPASVPPALAPVPQPRASELKPPRHGVIARVSDCLDFTWRRVVDMIVSVLG